MGRDILSEDFSKIAYLVEGAHGSRCVGHGIVHKEKQRIFRSQLDSFTDQLVELTDAKFRRHKVFLLVKISDAALRSFLHNNLQYRNRIECEYKRAIIVSTRMTQGFLAFLVCPLSHNGASNSMIHYFCCDHCRFYPSAILIHRHR